MLHMCICILSYTRVHAILHMCAPKYTLHRYSNIHLHHMCALGAYVCSICSKHCLCVYPLVQYWSAVNKQTFHLHRCFLCKSVIVMSHYKHIVIFPAKKWVWLQKDRYGVCLWCIVLSVNNIDKFAVCG